jgi:hypothetical protein
VSQRSTFVLLDVRNTRHDKASRGRVPGMSTMRRRLGTGLEDVVGLVQELVTGQAAVVGSLF